MAGKETLLPCLYEVEAWLASDLLYANLPSTGPALSYRSPSGTTAILPTLEDRMSKTAPATWLLLRLLVLSSSPYPRGWWEREEDRTQSQFCSGRVLDAAGIVGTLTIVALGALIPAGT